MKIHPQIISQKDQPIFVVLPYKEYKRILSIIEDVEDIKAIEVTSKDSSERFPLIIIERIASGESAIKVFREYRGLTQTELANKAAVTKQYINQIESGERLGTIKLLKTIAKILNVDLTDIT